ncbi:MAG: hypothetical protein M0P76_06360 [Candidatus Pacebacteria bacterium]|jgi:hypothetical protein|nr:hypothetical protein [Candidatus Paceibacterota bacterium]
MQFIKQIIGLLLVVAVGYFLYTMAMKATGGPKDFAVDPGNTATFTGTVVTNITSCFDSNDAGKCFLQVKSGTAVVFVVYNTSDTGFCVNETATAAGRNIQTGDSVRVYGYYKLEGDIHTVLTCPNTKYYIKKI